MNINSSWQMLASSIGLSLAVAGCTYPQTQTVIGNETAYVQIQNAPEGALVSIDGLELGPADSAHRHPGKTRTGRKARPRKIPVDYLFPVRPGTHRVVVMDGESILINRKVFSGSAGITIIKVPRR